MGAVLFLAVETGGSADGGGLMIIDRMLGWLGGLLDRLIDLLPEIDTSGWGIAQALATIAGYVETLMYLFPPMDTVVIVLGAMVAVEVALIALFWLNWLISKIPFI